MTKRKRKLAVRIIDQLISQPMTSQELAYSLDAKRQSVDENLDYLQSMNLAKIGRRKVVYRANNAQARVWELHPRVKR